MTRNKKKLQELDKKAENSQTNKESRNPFMTQLIPEDSAEEETLGVPVEE